MTHSYQILSPEEWATLSSAAAVPDKKPVDFFDAAVDIYKVAEEGRLMGQEGRILISSGESVKVLDAHRDEPWCYQVKRLKVYAAGGFVVSLKAGSYIAVLPEDYRKMDRSGDGEA